MSKKQKNVGIFIVNILWLLLELIIISIIILFLLLFLSISILLLIEIFQGSTEKIFCVFMNKKCACGDIIKCYNDCNYGIECDCYNNYIETLLTLFGMALTGILVPVLSIIISIITSARSISNNITNELAKAKNVDLFCLKFPQAIWGNLIPLYKKFQHDYKGKGDSTLKPLSSYQYALHLFFSGEIFQEYNVNLIKLRAIYQCKDNVSETTLWQNRDNSVCLLSDVSGVNAFHGDNVDNSGTNITALIDNCYDEDIEKFFIDGQECPIKLIFTLNFKEYRISLKERWLHFYGMYTFFPIIKSLIGFLVLKVRRYICYDFELLFSGNHISDDRDSQVKFHILDVSIKQVRQDDKRLK